MSADDYHPSETARLDPALAAALFVKHHEELRRFLLGVTRDAELAGEVLQAAFAKLVEYGHTARSETLKGWLFQVAFNEAMVVRRKQGVQERSIGELIARQKPGEATPMDHALRREIIEQVRAALAQLPPQQAEVVRMRMYDHKKFADIAKEIGVPLGTVLTRMQLALKKLRAALGE